MIPLLPWEGETGVMAPERDEVDMAKWKPKCPRCGSHNAQRDGSAGNGKQRYKCKVCGKSYIGHRDAKREMVRDIASALILQGIPVPILAKALQRHCSRRYLYNLRTSLING